jgi:serine O-acetyltransferase
MRARRPPVDERQAWKQAVLRERAARQPSVRRAIAADARAHSGERPRSRGALALLVARLLWDDDAFAALALYRVRARLAARGVPVLPRLAHHLSMALASVCIGDPVVVAAGVRIPHGSVVVDGVVDIGAGTTLMPAVTVGLLAGQPRGPAIGRSVVVGPGAKVLGPVTVGDRAVVGANAVVVGDVAPGAEVVGIPASERRR